MNYHQKLKSFQNWLHNQTVAADNELFKLTGSMELADVTIESGSADWVE